MIHNLRNHAIFARAGSGVSIPLPVSVLPGQPLERFIDSVEKVVFHTLTVYVFIRKSSFGQTQYMPPGIPADLMTRVATMGVVHCGHGLPD